MCPYFKQLTLEETACNGKWTRTTAVMASATCLEGTFCSSTLSWTNRDITVVRLTATSTSTVPRQCLSTLPSFVDSAPGINSVFCGHEQRRKYLGPVYSVGFAHCTVHCAVSPFGSSFLVFIPYTVSFLFFWSWVSLSIRLAVSLGMFLVFAVCFHSLCFVLLRFSLDRRISRADWISARNPPSIELKLSVGLPKRY
jgi:hypothetical protein